MRRLDVFLVFQNSEAERSLDRCLDSSPYKGGDPSQYTYEAHIAGGIVVKLTCDLSVTLSGMSVL